MRNIVLRLAYDGTRYFGWQRTHAGPSIEQTLQETVEKILNEPIALQAASRTDRGVHAGGQVVNFYTSKQGSLTHWIRSFNALLPKDLRILEGWVAPAHFHPTLDSIGKRYAYSICMGPIQLPCRRLFSWHVPGFLNLETMKQAAAYLIGEHDFSTFCNVRKHLNYPHKRRKIDSIEILEISKGQLLIEITGNQFLYKMVRTLVGTLADVGKGKLSFKEIPAILLAKTRTHAGVTAPAHGLTLKEIFYPQEFPVSVSSSSLECI